MGAGHPIQGLPGRLPAGPAPHRYRRGVSDAVGVEGSGREVKGSSPDKGFFTTRGAPQRGRPVAAPRLAEMGGRPTMLQRFPDGAHGKSFFQKRVPKGVPDWLQTTVVSTPNGTTSNALVVADLAHLIWAG